MNAFTDSGISNFQLIKITITRMGIKKNNFAVADRYIANNTNTAIVDVEAIMFLDISGKGGAAAEDTQGYM
jgi:hypothetical protein